MQAFLIGAAIKLGLIVAGTLLSLYLYHHFLVKFWEEVPLL